MGSARAAKFDLDGREADEALFAAGDVDAAEVARSVATKGFYDGPPIGAAACANCHADVAAQWAASAHRFASFNNPYYALSVEEFRHERGKKESRFCAGCHDPLLVASGAIDGDFSRATRDAQAGVVCLVCHSIDQTDLVGNGEYHAHVGAVPYQGAGHSARVRPPLLGTAKLCASCHKVGLTEEVTHDRWLRGQDDYDPWDASAVSGHGAGSLYRPPSTSRCQDCHMPYEPATLGDAAAKPGPDGVPRIRSHRFLGANAALPSLRGDGEQLRRTEEFLRNKVVMDLAPAPRAGEPGTTLVDVVLRANGIGHRFPGGTMDSNEVWLAVEALDGAGRVVASSGDLGARGDLADDAHLVRVQAVDGEGQPIARRDPQHARGNAYDQALTPSDPRAVRYAIPSSAAAVRVRLLYRKFSAAYARAACAAIPDPATRRTCEAPPVVEVARAEVPLPTRVPAEDDCDALLGPLHPSPGAPPDLALAWRRLVNHGVALAETLAEVAPEAAPLLACARKLAPDRAEPLVGLARLAYTLGQTDRVVELARAASAIAPRFPAPLLVEAKALYDAYRFRDARAPIEKLAALLPDDRAVLALVARERGVTHDRAGALAAADHLLRLDPESEEGHYQRMLALRDLGRTDEARVAEERYLRHRAATEVDQDLRQKFRATHPGRSDEDVPVHTHRLHAR